MTSSTIKRRYGILFEEGPGYLLVDYLNSGSFGQATLVLSLANNKLFVRKLHDVQLFNLTKTIQCSDVENAVSHSSVPRLIGADYYEETIRDAKRREYKYTTPATIWQFCNGGTLFTVFDRYQYGGNHDFPEVFLWKVLSSALSFLLSFHEAGYVHTDLHMSNIMLHYPSNIPVPEVFIIDFGLASRYPKVNDAGHERPFLGPFGTSYTARTNVLRGAEREKIRKWYEDASRDAWSIIHHLVTLLCGRRADKIFAKFIQERPRDSNNKQVRKFLAAASKRGTGVNGYSDLLVVSIHEWAELMFNQWSNPPEYLYELKSLYRHVAKHTDRRVHEFETAGSKVHAAAAWMLPKFPRAFPMTFANPHKLFHPAAPNSNWNVRVNSEQERALGEEVFSPYVDGFKGSQKWPRGRPMVPFMKTSAGDEICLRRGEFRVVELAVNRENERFQVVRKIDECPCDE